MLKEHLVKESYKNYAYKFRKENLELNQGVMNAGMGVHSNIT